MPRYGATDAGLPATIVLPRREQSTIAREFARTVLVAKGVEDGEICFSTFDDEFTPLHLGAI